MFDFTNTPITRRTRLRAVWDCNRVLNAGEIDALQKTAKARDDLGLTAWQFDNENYRLKGAK